MRAQRQAGEIDQAGDDQHPETAVAVRQHAGHRLRHAPDEILQGDGHAEDLPGEGQVSNDRLQKHPEGLSNPHADGDNDASDEHQRNKTGLAHPVFIPKKPGSRPSKEGGDLFFHAGNPYHRAFMKRAMQVYQVGGAVRDELLGLELKDRDWVVVGSSPAEMTALGYLEVGKDFPVFLHPDTKEEYALARAERKTGPGYRGFAVDASADITLEEDLQRRDFTINAIARDAEGNLIDPYGGAKDLEDKIIRHVSPAFVEDPLRGPASGAVCRPVRLHPLSRHAIPLAGDQRFRGASNHRAGKGLGGDGKGPADSAALALF